MGIADLLDEWAKVWRYEDRAFTLAEVESELHEMDIEIEHDELRMLWRKTLRDQISYGVWKAVIDVIVTAYPEFITFVYNMLAKLPGGEMFDCQETCRIPAMGWNEPKILSRLLDSIVSLEDVYLALSMLETGEDVLD